MTRLFDVAIGVAPLLDGRFRYNCLEEEKTTYDWGNRAVLNDDTETGRQILLTNCSRKPERIVVSGRLINGYGRTSITVANSRDIPSIAGDINRRFLPDYLKEWEKRQDEQAERTAKMEAYKHRVDLIRHIVPDFWSRNGRALTGSDEFYFKGGRVRLSCSEYDEELRLSLPYDDLVRVLVYLSEIKKPEIE